MSLHAELYGALHRAAPIVLLHGFGGTAAAWTAVAKTLAAELPVIAYDLPGHGGSLSVEPAGGAGWMAKAIVADLHQRDVEKFHLAGHSMGGAVAALIALRTPEQVKSLTLFAPGGFGRAINGEALRCYVSAGNREEMRAALLMMSGRQHPVSDAEVESTLERRRLSGAREALKRILGTILVDAGGREQGTLPVENLGRLAMPVRVLWGEGDGILPVMQADGLPSNVAVHRLPEAGHMLIDECPEAVVRFIRLGISQAV